jgi:hypothetical protein
MKKANDYTEAKYYEDNLTDMELTPQAQEIVWEVIREAGITPETMFGNAEKKAAYAKFLAKNK